MGRQINQSIVIDAKVRATLEDMNEVVSKLNQGLRESATKIDLTKGVGSSLSKNLDKFKDEYSKFSKFIEGGKIEFADAKDAVKSGETLIKTFREMKRIIGDFDDLTVLDAKKLFPDAFDSKVSGLLGGLDKLSSAMMKLESRQLDLSTAETEMRELRDRAKELETIMQEEITLKVEVDKTQADLDAIEQEIDAIRKKASEGITLKINTANKEAGDAKTKKDEILAARAARGFNEDDFAGSRTGSTKFKGKTMAQWTAEGSKKGATEATKAEAAAAQEAIRLYEREKNALADLSAIIADREKQAKQLSDTLAKLGTMKLPEAVVAAGGTPEEITEATAALERQKDATEANAAAQGKYKVAATQAGRAKKDFDGVTAAIDAQQAKIDKLTLEIGEMKKEVSTEALEKAFSSAGVEGFTAEMLKSKDGIEKLREKLNELDDKKLKLLKQGLRDMGFSADQAEDYIKQLRGGLRDVETEADGIKRAANEMENLKSQVLQFFSVTNAIQLFKRAVTSALNTVKELDATMTEAAVVTEFDIGDMWDKLPEYSASAQKLGVSINGMYQATTLYYQQGLKTNEAMALGVETMKMAKIASMDSTEATKAMTAALRGFNMELNETSAARVNDVYSQLAAVTAADTNQIATAMEKTASIAASANMEFETTAALLAQIIETTQEAPETAGTAMKTIIARFSEVKELKNQGLTTGKDEEGEDIDVNKIQTALRTVGISMEGFFNGTEGLDSILLKLSEKWETLDFETQRYIATMAAGSRQQSRFIAMMSDYGRTTELVNEAQNSAGASQRQFEKTQDSLETSIQRLKNAWDEFLMGLANNEAIKFAVDALTNILEVVNKLTDGLSGGNGLIKSIVSLGVALSALKIGKSIFGESVDSGLIGRVLGAFKPAKEGTGTIKEKTPGVGEKIKQKFAPAAGMSGTGKDEKKSFKERWRESYDAKRAEIADQKAARREQGKWKKTITVDETQEKLGVITGGLAEDDTSERAEGIRKLNEELSQGKITTEQAREGYVKLGGDIKDLGEVSQTTAVDAQAVGTSFSNVGTACMGIGAGLGLLASLFDALGLEEASEATQDLAAVFIGFGTVLSVVGSILPSIISLTAAQAAATWAALWPILLIVAALALVLVAVVAIAKAAKKNSLEGRLEDTAKAADEAAEAARGAKEAYDQLLADREEYNDLQSKLEGLTKGTQEWQTALSEVNQQVLALLGTYPELAKYLKTGENGQLLIEDKGWDFVIENSLENVRRASGEALRLRRENMKVQQEKIESTFTTKLGYKSIRDESSTKSYSGEWGEVNSGKYEKDTFDKLIEAYEKNPAELFKLENPNADLSLDESYSEGLQQIAEESNYTAEELYNLKDSLADFVKETDAMSVQMSETGKALLLSSYDSKTMEYDYVSEIATGFTEGLDSASKKASKTESDIGHGAKGSNVKKSNNTQFLQIAEYYGAKNNLSDKAGMELENLQQVYMKMSGYTKVDQIPQAIRESEEKLKEAIAEGYEQDKFVERNQEFIKRVGNLEKIDQRLVAALTSGDASSFKGKDFKNLEGKTFKGIAEEMGYSDEDYRQLAKDFGYEDLKAQDLDEADQDALKKYWKSQGEDVYINYVNGDGTLTEAGKIYNVAAEVQLNIDRQQEKERFEEEYNEIVTSVAGKVGTEVDVEGIFSDMTVQDMKGVQKQIEDLTQEEARAYLDGIDKISGQVKNKAQAISYLAEVDWSNMNEGIDAMDYLLGQGADPSAVIEFWKETALAAGAYLRTITDVANVMAGIQGSSSMLTEVIERLKQGKGTAEDIHFLQSLGVTIGDKLTYGAEGWGLDEATANEIFEQGQSAIITKTQGVAEVQQATKDDYQKWVTGPSKRNEDEADVEKRAVSEATDWQIAEYIRDKYKKKTELYNEDGSVNISKARDFLQKEQDSSKGTGFEFEKQGHASGGLLDYMYLDQETGKYVKKTQGSSAAQMIEDFNAGKTGSESLIDMLNLDVSQWVDENGDLAYDNAELNAYLDESLRGAIALLNDETTNMTKEMAAYTTAQSKTADEWRLSGEGDELTQIYASQGEFQRAGGDISELTQYTEYIQELGVKSKAVATEMAKDIMTVNDGLEEISQNFESWETALKSPGSEQYALALESMRSSMKKVLGVNIKLSESFLTNEENLQLMKKAAEGDSKALAELRKEAVKEIMVDVGINWARRTWIQNQIDNFMDSLEYEDLQIGAQFDTTTLADQFEIMLKSGQMTVDQMNAILTGIGWTPEISYAEVPVADASKYLTHTNQQVVNPATGQLETVTAENIGEFAQDGVVQMPIIGDNATKFQGFNIKTGGTFNGHSFSGSSSSDGGGGGGSKGWENPYDDLYNTVAKINEELRKREKLERRYQNLLNRNAATAKELAELTKQQLDSLETELKDRETVLEGRKRQMNEIMTEYSDVSQYARYDEKTGQIIIDWEKLEALDGSTDDELTSRVEEYISKLEEKEGEIEEEESAIEDIRDAAWGIYEQGKDSYFGLEDRIKEAIISERQKEIDKLSEINDSINDTNSKLLDSMQEQIDEYRQNRDNEKIEQELSDKQRRLAYLSQDTSGANALEIKQLQKELDEAQEDYTDTLIDQKISELQKQNDQAAEQRQQQIDLQQALLDQYSESPEIWEEVKQLMDEGLDPENGLIRGSQLEELLKSADGFEGLSTLKKMDWLNELNNTAAQALAWLESGALQSLYGQDGQVTFTDKDGNVVTGTINEDGDVITEDSRLYSGKKFKIDQNGKVISYETGEEASANWAEEEKRKQEEEEEKTGAGDIASLPASTRLTKENKKALQRGLNRLLEHGKLSGFAKLTVDGNLGSQSMAALAILQKAIGMSTTGAWGPKTYKAFHSSDLKAYETGGLADFTGPAWLDGTKSRPEYILNADQTKAFFNLVDVLGSLQSGDSKTAQNSGDNTYDIDINVESIGSDYDVEQLADTVKRLINEDARYRNNNAINLMR